MNRTDALRAAEDNHSATGIRWHVVELEGEYWDVSEYWLKKHDVEPVYSVGVVESYHRKKKLSVVRKIIFHFNLFLLWATKKLTDAAADNDKV